MKRFILVVSALALLAIAVIYAVYFRGLYLDVDPNAPVTAVFRTEGKQLLRQTGTGEWESFVIRGVDVSSNLPGHPTLEFAPEPEDYLRWLECIAEMGANTIRVYTVMDADFYEAFYQYNVTHQEPLYLLQGLQVSDAANYGAEDVYDETFLGLLLENGRAAVDVIHGNKIIALGDTSGTGRYRWDISTWVIGYLVGHEWDSGNIAYTNQSTTYSTDYQGTYFTTTSEATRFEAAMARVMDQIVAYESDKYKTQRLLAFVNDPANDPFIYEDIYAARFLKYTQTDAEHIQTTQALLSGYFAAYRLNYFCPDFLQYFSREQRIKLGNLLVGLDTETGYHGYLALLGRYHTIPVVAAGYGFSTSRAAIFENENPLNERQQGEALVQVWRDAGAAGWAGVFVSTWQDVWDRRTWNTADAVYDTREPTWQDIQTEGQSYGLMEFRLGDGKVVCCVDGDPSEWTLEDVVLETEEGRLSMRYDEKYLYFLAEWKAFDPETDILYLPLDITPKTGSTYCENYDLTFERASDFVICIQGTRDSRVLVQERYERLWAMHAYETDREDAYYELREKDAPLFRPIRLMVQRSEPWPLGQWSPAVTYETGILRYGTADPEAAGYDSLTDYCFTEEGVELRIPWQLLNFADPSEMLIHDDYYQCYGVEYLQIQEMYVGLASGEDTEERIRMAPFALEGWGGNEIYHERLKESYYILQAAWTALGE